MNFRNIIAEDQSLLNEYIKDINNFQTYISIVTIFLFQEFKIQKYLYKINKY